MDKVKERLKDEVMKSQSKVSYIKVVNKEYGTFFTFLRKAKENFIKGFKEKPIFILENVANMTPIVSNVTGKVEYEGTEESKPETKYHNTSNDTEVVKESIGDIIHVCPHCKAYIGAMELNNENKCYKCGGNYRYKNEPQVTQPKINYTEEDLHDHHGIAAVITDDYGRILVQDHIKFDFWTIPIGKVKCDETIEDGLIVEMKEELNITPTKYRELFVTKKTYDRNGKPVTVIQHVFHITGYSGTIRNNELHKHRCIKWMTMDEIEKQTRISDATKNYIAYTNGHNFVVEGTLPKEQVPQLVPVYVLLTYTDSMMAKAIKAVTHQPYSHAGISLDSSMKQIFTYGRKEVNDICKFTDENIFNGALGKSRDKVKYSLYVTFFDRRQFMSLRERIDNIREDVNKHGYNYKGLINFALGKETHDDDRMFCSQFVADVIKAGDPKRIKRHTSRYSPTDLSRVQGMHFVTKGILANYDSKKVEEIVEKIKETLVVSELKSTFLESFFPKDTSSLSLYCESNNMVDFVNELNSIDDIDVLEASLVYLNDLHYINKVRDRIKVLENTHIEEKEKCLYIIIESTLQRLSNNRLNIFNINDSETSIYTVEESKEGINVDFNVDKFKRKGTRLVQEACENKIPYEDNKVYVSYKVTSDVPEAIENIRENFLNVQAWKPFATMTTLNLMDEAVMESYGLSMLKSINVDMDTVEIKRHK